jgi:anti-sigma factor RsiW
MNKRPCESLEEFLAGDLAVERRSEFENHCADCPSCRAAVEDWQALRQILQAATLELESPSAALSERIERGPTVFARAVANDERTWKVAALLAASLLAAVLFGDILRPVSPVATTNPRAAEAVTTAALSPPPKIEFTGDVIGVPIDVGDPKVTVVWLYPEARVADATN